MKKKRKLFVSYKKNRTFALALQNERQGNRKIDAAIAQLVEHNLAKVGVASSSLVCRSTSIFKIGFVSIVCWRGGGMVDALL